MHHALICGAHEWITEKYDVNFGQYRLNVEELCTLDLIAINNLVIKEVWKRHFEWKRCTKEGRHDKSEQAEMLFLGASSELADFLLDSAHQVYPPEPGVNRLCTYIESLFNGSGLFKSWQYIKLSTSG